MRLNTAWIKGLKPDEAQKIKELVLGNKILLDKLIEMLYNMIREAENVNINDYDSPSWSHKQAHINGHNAAIRKLIEVCTLSDQDK